MRDAVIVQTVGLWNYDFLYVEALASFLLATFFLLLYEERAPYIGIGFIVIIYRWPRFKGKFFFGNRRVFDEFAQNRKILLTSK